MSEQDDASVDRFLDGLDDRRDEDARDNERRRRISAAVQKWELMTWATDDAFGYTGSNLIHVNGEEVADERPIYEALAEAGADGWELVSAMQTKYRVVLVFKRPKAEG